MHQVWKGITFPGENEDIILHDSGGFEAANETGFEEIRKFLKDRLARRTLAEQLHCIWSVMLSTVIGQCLDTSLT